MRVALCLHRATGIFVRICDDCHDDELRRSEECVSRCACTEQRAFLCEYVTTVTMMSSEGAKNACRVVLARAGAEPQAPQPHKRRKPTCV